MVILIPEEGIVVKVQQMFPNCSKYKHCCDESWNKNLETESQISKDYIQLLLEEISKREWNTKNLTHNKAPEGFDGY